MIKIGNQPVSFITPNNAHVDEVRYNQLVQQGDVTEWQMLQETPFNNQQKITNGAFTTNLTGWTVSGGWQHSTDYGGTAVNYSGSTTAYGQMSQDVLTVGQRYRLEIVIIVNETYESRGGSSATGGTGVIIEFGTNRIKTLKTAGHFLVEGNCEGNGLLKIIGGSGANEIVVIDKVELLPAAEVYVPNHIVGIYDSAGNYIDRLTYLNDYLAGDYTLSSDVESLDGWIKWALSWNVQGIADGCYRLGIMDADTNTNSQNYIYNGDFAVYGDLQGWTLLNSGTGVGSIATTKLVYTAGAGAGSTSLLQTKGAVGTTYSYSVKIDANTNSIVYIQAGTTLTPLAGTGVKTGTITSANTTDLGILIINTIAGASATVDYIHLEAVSADLTPDYYSNYFNLQTEFLQPTLLINAHNSSNAFNLNFESITWTPRVRLEAYISPADQPYDIQRETEVRISGTKTVNFYNRRKREALVIVNEPPFIHDFLSTLIGYDHIYANNVQYFVDEDDYPTISWNRYRTLGGVALLVTLKSEVTRNVRKIADTGGYQLEGAVLIAPTGGSGLPAGFLGDLDILLAEYQGHALAIRDLDGTRLGAQASPGGSPETNNLNNGNL